MPDLQPPDVSPPTLGPPAHPGATRRSPRPGADPATGARPGPLPRPGVDPAGALAANRTAMLGSARRVSLCEDDAQDAVQAAAERFLKHQDRVDPETVTGWLVTVARNEALRVRERRVRSCAIDDDDRRLIHVGDGPDDVVAREEDLALAREALGRLKPQERLALWMQAEGRSYDEIAQELSWTRTKVNRSITEGRASLRRTLAGIATGEGCASAGPRINRLATGDASADDLRELRPHLRRCASCRGRLRRARGARWGVVPPVLLAWLPWAGRGGGAPSVPVRTRVTEAVAERLAFVLPASAGGVTEAGLALTTGLAVVALGAGVATGGGTGEGPTAREAGSRPARAAPATADPAVAAGPAGTPSPVAATRTTLVRTGRTLEARGAAVVAEAEARRRAEARARERARRRAAAEARRRREARAEARERAAASTRAGAAATSGTATAAGTAPATGTAPSVATPSTGAASSGPGAAPSGSGSTSGGGAAAGSGGGAAAGAGGSGSAADEFGFE